MVGNSAKHIQSYIVTAIDQASKLRSIKKKYKEKIEHTNSLATDKPVALEFWIELEFGNVGF